DRRIPVPVRRPDADDVASSDTPARSWHYLEESISFVAERIHQLNGIAGKADVHVLGTDARDLQALSPNGAVSSPTLVITSPPYGAAQKYVRSSSLSIGWLGLAARTELSALERESIGREHMSSSDLRSVPTVASRRVQREIDRIASSSTVRAAIYANYFSDMDLALQAIYNTLEPGGHLALVAARNYVAGSVLQTPDLLKVLALKNGFDLVLEVFDRIQGRLLMTKRASTSGPPIDSEHVLLLRRG
ncbi:MAG: hypothetical protein R2711_18390, partial [Acidimicrobiales bacterium]